jgi:serine/threonine protein kinase
MRKEVKIMSELYHPNIVLFMGACFRKGQMAMVTEIMPEVRSQSVRRHYCRAHYRRYYYDRALLVICCVIQKSQLRYYKSYRSHSKFRNRILSKTTIAKHAHLKKNKPLLSTDSDTSLGMNWLHTRNPTILHRDLKPANLLMDKDWNVKVSFCCFEFIF